MTEYDILLIRERKEENLCKISEERKIVNEKIKIVNERKIYYEDVIQRTTNKQKKKERLEVYEEFIKNFLLPLKERLRRLAEKELHEHVVSYSQYINQEDADFIINAFDSMIWIYVHIVCRQTGFKISRRRDRKFVSLFCPKFIYKSLEKYMVNTTIKNTLCDGAQYIRYIFRLYNEDEIRNECRIVLLEMASKYKEYERPSFHTLVDRIYHYKLYSNLMKLIKDPCVRKDHCDFDEYVFAIEDSPDIVTLNLLSENDAVNDFELADRRIDFYYEINKETAVLKKPDMMDLDINWILGNTATGIFKNLTVTERKILKLKYFNNLSDLETAKQLGLTVSVVGNKKRAMLVVLNERYEEMEDNRKSGNKAEK